MRWLLSLVVFLSFSLQAQPQGNIETLSKWMQGAFTSELQSQQDKDFFNIHLYMKRIWKNEQQGYWLYVEQAAASNLDKPYRQRVYHLTEVADGRFKSEVFTFANPLDHAGAWQSDAPLADLDPGKLTTREGCAVFLKWQEAQNAFIGSTEHKNCKSKLRGATYATSKVSVFVDRIESWDQGYDSNDKQVWGAEKSGYVFQRKE